MHQVRRRETFGQDVASLHELEAEFQSVRVIQSPSHCHGPAHEAVALDGFGNPRLMAENGVHGAWNASEMVEANQTSQSASERCRKQIKSHQLAGIGFVA